MGPKIKLQKCSDLPIFFQIFKIGSKTSKTSDDLVLLENYRKNSDIIEKMKPIMFLLKLYEKD